MMQVPINSAATQNAWQWRHAALSFLALSAAISVELLEERGADGKYRFARGRHKYYGIGSLVIFFAIFSGYGMGHMLATMSTISAWGAVIAGLLWAAFQWCLERQMLISIRADALWWHKLFGLGWRGLLALLSASTMVYPFFVESNRAEIDVKVGEMARTRLIDNVQSAQLAVGLPALRNDATQVTSSIKQVDALLAIDPPELAAYRQQAKLCWQAYAKQETKIRAQIRTTQTLANSAGSDALLEIKINALLQKMQAAKVPCQQADNVVMNKLLEWKQQKNAEKKSLLSEQKNILSTITLAKQKEVELSESQEKKIKLAAQSGFAADFAAVAELVKHDANRRFQLIWWLVWFLAIEMVAILVKFTSTTDVDLCLNSEEVWTQDQIEHQLRTEQEQLATKRLQATMQAKGEQAVWLEDDGQQARDKLNLERQLDIKLHQQLAQFNGELRLNFEALKVRLNQLEAIQDLARQTSAVHPDSRIEQLIKDSIETVMASVPATKLSSIN